MGREIDRERDRERESERARERESGSDREKRLDAGVGGGVLLHLALQHPRLLVHLRLRAGV